MATKKVEPKVEVKEKPAQEPVKERPEVQIDGFGTYYVGK